MAKYEIEGVDALSVNEVVDQFVVQYLDSDEKIGDVRLECGCDLEVDILHNEPGDPRIHGTLSYTKTLTVSDLREDAEGDVFFWARNEYGEEVLLCRN